MRGGVIVKQLQRADWERYIAGRLPAGVHSQLVTVAMGHCSMKCANLGVQRLSQKKGGGRGIKLEPKRRR